MLKPRSRPLLSRNWKQLSSPLRRRRNLVKMELSQNSQLFAKASNLMLQDYDRSESLLFRIPWCRLNAESVRHFAESPNKPLSFKNASALSPSFSSTLPFVSLLRTMMTRRRPTRNDLFKRRRRTFSPETEQSLSILHLLLNTSQISKVVFRKSSRLASLSKICSLSSKPKFYSSLRNLTKLRFPLPSSRRN